LIGGGHAHVQVIKAFHAQSRPSHLDVTLIDAQSSAIYSGMVPGCISNLYHYNQTKIQLGPLAQWANITFVKDVVVDIDVDNCQIQLQSQHQPPISYDCISIDIGSTTKGIHSIPGVLEYTIPTRPIRSLVQHFENHLDYPTNKKKHDDNDNDDDDDDPIVIVGGGAAGIELSMAIRARWNPSCEIRILNGGSKLFPKESKDCQNALDQILQERNIQVWNHCHVESITDNTISLFQTSKDHDDNDDDDDKDVKDPQLDVMPYSHCVWATGAAPHSSLIQKLQNRGLSIDPDGWINVSSHLQSTSHPNIFAAGDCAHILLENTNSPPKAGVYAVRAGPILIHNLLSFLQTTPMIPYRPQDDFLKLIMCGDGTALGFRFGIPIYGSWVWKLKDRIDTLFMDLFDPQLLPELSNDDETSDMDMSQYDAIADIRPDPLRAKDAALLLQRTDEDVDFERAWDVIRDMMEDDVYKEKVLSYF